MNRNQAEMLKAMVESMEALSQLRDMITGQRDALIRENGFSKELADQMAADLWHMMMHGGRNGDDVQA